MSSAAKMLPAWHRSTLASALAGSLLMWASLPPLALGWLAWVAPVPWLLLIRASELPGRRPYRSLYLAGLAFWLAAIYWLSLPHPMTIPLWILLASYLAFYVPVFVGLGRLAIHRFSMPLWLAAPIIWTGLELARAHLLTGFLMASLAHTQVKWAAIIQISDLVGEYGVDFVVMLTAACIAAAVTMANFGSRLDPDNPQSAIRNPKSPFLAPLALLPAALALAATLGYGHVRINQSETSDNSPHQTIARVALIQGNSLADWKLDEEKQQRIMDEYIRLSQQATAEAAKLGDGRPPSLIVWPETMYRNPLREFESGFQLPTRATRTTEEITTSDRRELAALAAHLGAPLLVGIERVQFLVGPKSNADRPAYRGYNSAALADPGGEVVNTYDKVHLVMFGEYIPFARWLPFLNQISSLTGSVEAGDGPVAMCKGGVCYVPSICYETCIPHVIRHQVATLESRGERPDALVNMTNDAWYWGSSGLDMHLACGVFRAVEMRLPLVIAANGGISAHIDALGRIRTQSPRGKPDFLIADIEPATMASWYVRFGDWFAGICLASCVLLAAVGGLTKTRRHGDKETRR